MIISATSQASGNNNQVLPGPNRSMAYTFPKPTPNQVPRHRLANQFAHCKPAAGYTQRIGDAFQDKQGMDPSFAPAIYCLKISPSGKPVFPTHELYSEPLPAP